MYIRTYSDLIVSMILHDYCTYSGILLLTVLGVFLILVTNLR
jgi:hypothetical protein